MNFTNFMQSLLPSFSKDHVIEDTRVTKGELNEATIPAYRNAVLTLKGYDFKSQQVKEKIKVFNRNISGSRDMIGNILDGLIQASENLEAVEKMISKTYSEEVAAAGMSYRKANLLQYAEFTSFVSKYARRFLIYVFVAESADYKENSLSISDSLSKAEIQWIDENFVNFITAFKTVTFQKDKLIKALENIPDIVITPDNEETLSGGSAAKIDPLSMRFIPTWLNPFYHIGMRYAEWQADRYKSAKEELAMLQLRRLHLENLKAGKADPALEKEISHMESRIQRLNYKIAELEESAK